MSNVQIIAWCPHEGHDSDARCEFLHPQHFFRFLEDLRELQLPWREVTAWVVLEDQRAVRPFQPYRDPVAGWCLIHRSPSHELRIDAIAEDLPTLRQRRVASSVEGHLIAAYGDVVVELLTPDEWANVRHEGAERWAPYGYVPLGHVAPGVAAICPATIERQAAELDDDEFEGYGQAISLRIMARASAEDSEDVTDPDLAADNLILQQNPALFELMQRVALDAAAG